jgi:hypothetical protein
MTSLTTRERAGQLGVIPPIKTRKPGKPVTIWNGVSLTQIQKKTGLTLSYLSRVFMGRKVPTIKTLNTIAAAVGISPGILLEALNGLRPTKALKRSHRRRR